MKPQELFEKMAGGWEGAVKTWFRPGELADESDVAGEFTPILGGRFLRHTYEGAIKGKPRAGEELIAFNQATEEFQTAWVDDFHMNYAMMLSAGKATAHGFSVRGEYDTAPGQPRWGWRTDYQLIGADELIITAYNISPQGQEAKAVETTYRRAKP